LNTTETPNLETATAAAAPRRVSLAAMLGYAQGDCAISLVMNGIFGFAMLFYTKAIGLDPDWAGLALSVSVFWEAFSEPLMGAISDHTRSRWGNRHPYMLIGGILMAVCSYLIWAVPHSLVASQLGLFWYLVVVNLVLRTSLTLFFIPYMALGFEICTDYQDRTKLQSIRQILNMAANFAGPALAWPIFFSGRHATSVAANYRHMGAVFAIATGVFAILATLLTLRWRQDTRHNLTTKHQPHRTAKLLKDFLRVLADGNARWVFAFVFVSCAGMVVVSSLQMYVYSDFMRFSALQKTLVHGGTMVGMALGAASSIPLAKWFDKKGAVIVGVAITIGCSLMLAMLFSTGFIKPHAVFPLDGLSFPLALASFGFFHDTYWFGNGILLPVSIAMIADISEVHTLRRSENRDGSYSAVFSLAQRIAIATSLAAAGFGLTFIGYAVPTKGHAAVVQSPAVLWRLGMLMFVIGAAFDILALLVILKYPITRSRLEQERVAARARSAVAATGSSCT
jgi:GPH family glycoside/pentoside/hexuronide:cation symporter